MAKPTFTLPIHKSKDCPVELLQLDSGNPRLQTGVDANATSDEDLIATLFEISALEELITSICTNKYVNLEPMIVIGDSDNGPFRVLEGNRRLASIKLIRDPELAAKLHIKILPVTNAVLESTDQILCYRVNSADEARVFIGFKHINGPQRWDAYAKARYVTSWYKKAHGKVTVSEIAARMGDTNDTLQSYIYAMLILEQAASEGLWDIPDRTNNGRFAFSHLYTAIGRKEYQDELGLKGKWEDLPPSNPIPKSKLKVLGEVLSYIYGSRSSDQQALVRSQNPDLKDLGFALVNKEARLILRNKGTLEDAKEAIKNPNAAFQDSIIAANLKLKRAVGLIAKYDGSDTDINAVVEEVFEQADTLNTMVSKKKDRKHATK